jgi:hypothetical protein
MSILRQATIILMLSVAAPLPAQTRKELHSIGFYNLENLWADAILTDIPNID